MKLEDVFLFYNEYVKPVYSEIEATRNYLPTEYLFEIHAAFDHIKRIYTKEDTEEESIKGAFRHLKRAYLDANKLKLKYFNEDIEKLNLKKYSKGLALVDNGKFIINLYGDKAKIIKEGTNARITEVNNDLNEAFKAWDKVSTFINEFRKKYFEGYEAYKIEWGKSKCSIFKKHEFYYGALPAFVIGFFFHKYTSIMTAVRELWAYIFPI